MTANTIPSAPADPPQDEFHLLSVAVDPDSTTDNINTNTSASTNSTSSRSCEPVVLPAGVTSIQCKHQAVALLKPDDSSERETTTLLEPVTSPSGQPRLLVKSSQSSPVRVNGHTATRISLLSEGDRFSFNTHSFEVAIFHRPHLGPTPAESNGMACQICGTPLTPEERCLVCSCGALYHAPLDEAAEGALVCVKMASHCTRCNRPIRTTPGYGRDSVLPEEQANASQG